MVDAAIFRHRKKRPDGSDFVWYEYAPIVGGRHKHLSTHSAKTPEEAVERARADGYDPDPEVIDY